MLLSKQTRKDGTDVLAEHLTLKDGRAGPPLENSSRYRIKDAACGWWMEWQV